MNDVNYMCRVVEDYIFHRKNKRVKITPKPNELNKLLVAYNYSISWFNWNKI